MTSTYKITFKDNTTTIVKSRGYHFEERFLHFDTDFFCTEEIKGVEIEPTLIQPASYSMYLSGGKIAGFKIVDGKVFLDTGE